MKKALLAIFASVLVFSACANLDPIHRARVAIDVQPEVNPWTHLDFKNDPENFQFAIVSDRCGGERPGIFSQVSSKLNLLQPEFVMSVGDLIEGYNEDATEVARQWDELQGFVNALEMPFFHVVGNHDYTNQVLVDAWKQRFGRSYYHFVYHDVLFLIVNSEDPTDKRPNISEAQNAYMAEALAQNQDVRWTLVFLHRPLWNEKKDVGWQQLENNLQGRPYTVIAGHVHNYKKYERFGQEYYTLATTGGSSKLRGIEHGEFDHIVWVTMTEQGPRIANLMYEGIQDSNIRVENKLVGSLIPQTMPGQGKK